MSFTTTIKEEISEKEFEKSEIIAELSGYFRNNSNVSNNKIIVTTENKYTVNKITDSLKNIYNIEIEVEIIENLNFSKKNLYQISFSIKDNYILKDLGIKNENNKYLDTVPNYIVDSNEEIRAYLRGVFSACGSINDPKTSRYHMELLIEKPNEAVFVQKLLNNFELNAKMLNRGKYYMIYIKEAEKISDFLKIIGASKAVMYYENVRIYRDQKNMTNRLNNCEQANIDKIIQSADEQLKEIEIIENNNALSLLDNKVQEAIKYRKKYPEVSLKELAEIISVETNKKITKSGLNHRLRKMKSLATNLKKIQDENNKEK